MSYSRGPGVLHWHSIDTINNGLLAPQTAHSGTYTWPSANLAVYTPLFVRSRVTVTALWVATSATAANIDLGLYDASGVRLVSTGSVGKGTTTIEKVVDVTDTTIGPGLYYFAVAADNNTGTFTGAAPAAPLATAVGVLAEASAFTLPATATFALDHTLALYVAGGLMTTTLVA